MDPRKSVARLRLKTGSEQSGWERERDADKTVHGGVVVQVAEVMACLPELLARTAHVLHGTHEMGMAHGAKQSTEPARDAAERPLPHVLPQRCERS